MTVQGDAIRNGKLSEHEGRLDAIERRNDELAERIQRILDSLAHADWPRHG